MVIGELRDKHPGTITLVAPGPSVVHLAQQHLAGPVVAIYDALTYIEPLRASGVYALMKDGPGWPNACDCCTTPCEVPGMVRPEHATLLLHEPESGGCFPDYSPRIVFRMVEDLGFVDPRGIDGEPFIWGNSAQAAVALARHMGATSLQLVSFDAALGDHRVVEGDKVHVTTDYSYATQCLRNAVAGLPCEWITPKGDE